MMERFATSASKSLAGHQNDKAKIHFGLAIGRNSAFCFGSL
jgi:hypothetical protein